ncbi:MAG: MFS transporter, partial [Spirochaetota bacterium]
MKKGFVIPWREKFAYGIGDCAINIAYGSMGFYMLWFMVNVGGIAPALAGIIFAVAKIWDAVADYVFGRISDRTNHRLGRRRPFIIYGCIPLGLSFIFLWFVPFQGSAFDPSRLEWMRFGYYMIVYLIFETAFAAVSIPYGSLMPEMTQNYDERSVLSGFRLGSSFVGTLLGAAGVMFITDILLAGVPREKSFFYMGMAFAVLMIVILLFTGISSTERISERRHAQVNFLVSIKSFLKMKEFRIVVGMFVLNMVGIDIVMMLISFYFKDAIGLPDDIAFAFMALPLVTALLFSPFWVMMSEKIGKRAAYIIASVYMTCMLCGSIFVPHGNLVAV